MFFNVDASFVFELKIIIFRLFYEPLVLFGKYVASITEVKILVEGQFVEKIDLFFNTNLT